MTESTDTLLAVPSLHTVELPGIPPPLDGEMPLAAGMGSPSSPHLLLLRSVEAAAAWASSAYHLLRTCRPEPARASWALASQPARRAGLLPLVYLAVPLTLAPLPAQRSICFHTGPPLCALGAVPYALATADVQGTRAQGIVNGRAHIWAQLMDALKLPGKRALQHDRRRHGMLPAFGGALEPRTTPHPHWASMVGERTEDWQPA